VGNRCANHVTPLYPQKLALTSPTGGGRSVGMVRSRTKTTGFSFSFFNQLTNICATTNLIFPRTKVTLKIVLKVCVCLLACLLVCLFVFGARAPSGPDPPHSRGF